MTRTGGGKTRGLTLLEALLAAVVLAMAAGAILMPFTAGAQSLAQDARSTLAVNLAQDLMEEILTRAFKDPDTASDDALGRANWDDVSDYNGFAEGEWAIACLDGTRVTDAAAVGLSRRVRVESFYVTGQSQGGPPTFLKVTVEILYRGEVIVSLKRLVYENA